MDKRPKRRKDKYNPYTLCSEKGKYYVYFVDVNNRIQMVEVSKSVFETFNIFELEDISQMNEYDRHLEHSEVYEHTLHKKKDASEWSLEEYFENVQVTENLHIAMGNIQKLFEGSEVFLLDENNNKVLLHLLDNNLQPL